MSLEMLIKDGWFDKVAEFELPLSKSEIKELKKNRKVVVKKGDESFYISIRSGSDLNNLEESDVYIRKVK